MYLDTILVFLLCSVSFFGPVKKILQFVREYCFRKLFAGNSGVFKNQTNARLSLSRGGVLPGSPVTQGTFEADVKGNENVAKAASGKQETPLEQCDWASVCTTRCFHRRGQCQHPGPQGSVYGGFQHGSWTRIPALPRTGSQVTLW